jgi:predicted DNA-binding ribbon-helix-helix protein
MRTTITIDEGLLDELKKRAAREGTTVSRLIEESCVLPLGLTPTATPGNPSSSLGWTFHHHRHAV